MASYGKKKASSYWEEQNHHKISSVLIWIQVRHSADNFKDKETTSRENLLYLHTNTYLLKTDKVKSIHFCRLERTNTSISYIDYPYIAIPNNWSYPVPGP